MTKHYTENYNESTEPVLAVLTPLETKHYTENYKEQHEPVLAVLTPLETKHSKDEGTEPVLIQ